MKKLQYWIGQLFNMLLLFLGGKRKEETKAQKMYRLLSPIPKDEWLIGHFTNGEDKCCFIGHYCRLTSSRSDDYSFNNCSDFTDNKQNNYPQKSLARALTGKFIKGIGLRGYNGADVNNMATINGYTEDNPKDRVMHLLKDMIKAGY